MLDIVGHILTFLGAATALLGETWNGTQQGLRKLTKVGWAAAVVAASGLGLSIYVSVQNEAERTTYREIALGDMVGGWRQVALGIHIIDDIADGELGNDAFNMVVMSGYTEPGALSQFAAVDFGQTITLGNGDMPVLGEFICRSFARGMAILSNTTRNRGMVLGSEMAQQVANLGQSPTFAGILAAGGCAGGATDLNINRIGLELTRPAASAFINDLVDLGEDIGADRIFR